MVIQSLEGPQVDSEAIAEPEHTTPSPDTLKALADMVQGPFNLSGRRDGAEFCESFYSEEQGGYGYRRYSDNQEHPWRFMRSKDFEDNFAIFTLVEWSAVETVIETLIRRGVKVKERLRLAVKAMGPKTRKRFDRTIAEKALADVD